MPEKLVTGIHRKYECTLNSLAAQNCNQSRNLEQHSNQSGWADCIIRSLECDDILALHASNQRSKQR